MTAASSEQELTIVLLDEVSGLVRTSGLELAGLQPLKTVRGKNLHRFGVEVQAHGEAYQFVKFLQGAQESGHLLKCEVITLNAGRGESPIAVTIRLTKLARIAEATP